MLQHVDIERLIGHDAFQPGVLRLQILEPFRAIGFHPAVLGKSPMPQRLGNPELTTHLLDRHGTSHQLVVSASLRMICSGVWRRCFFVTGSLSFLPPTAATDSHNNWLT
jgi:hypothetical protein